MRKLIEPLRLLPILKVVAGFALGVYLSSVLVLSWWVWLIPLLPGMLLLWYGFSSKKYSQRWVFGFGVVLCSISMGAAYLALENQKRIENFDEVEAFVTLQVDENPIAAAYGARWSSTVVEAPAGLKQLEGTGCMVFSKDRQPLAYGDVVRVFARLRPVAQPKNPFEFSFKKYYAHQGVYATAYISEGCLLNIERGNTFFLIRWAKQVQRYTLDVFRQNGFTGDELGVLMALMIGDKQFLDANIKSSYANVGAMHILAVSGMHVALIYGVLVLLLFFLKGKRSAILRSVLVLGALWLYAFIAGFSPSIVRATVMFTFILVGRIADREYSIINLVAASFLVLLIINPYYLFDVGFLLSYAALMSILLFYPMLEVYAPRPRGLRWLYDLLAVSLAAQVLTLPLTLYYFHQFPLVFLATNIILIPLTSLIIYGALILLALSWWPFAAHLMSIALVWMLKAANLSVGYLESIPGAVMSGVRFEGWQMVALFIAFLILYIFMIHRSGRILMLSLALLFAILLGSSIGRIGEVKSRVVVYSLRKGTVVMLSDASGVTCVCDSVRSRYSYKFMEPSLLRWRYGSIGQAKFAPINDSLTGASLKMKNGWCVFRNKLIYIPMGRGEVNAINPPKIAVDLMVVTQRCQWRPLQLFKIIKPRQVVVDESVSNYQAQKWEKYCNANGVAVHRVSTRGAYVLEF